LGRGGRRQRIDELDPARPRVLGETVAYELFPSTKTPAALKVAVIVVEYDLFDRQTKSLASTGW
jgi:hypothetical protein